VPGRNNKRDAIADSCSELYIPIYIGNPRKLRIIWDSKDKSDLRDARILAMVCRVEPRLLWPIKHRDRQAYADLGIIKFTSAILPHIFGKQKQWRR
jgi:hypothetical protein